MPRQQQSMCIVCRLPNVLKTALWRIYPLAHRCRSARTATKSRRNCTTHCTLGRANSGASGMSFAADGAQSVRCASYARGLMAEVTMSGSCAASCLQCITSRIRSACSCWRCGAALHSGCAGPVMDHSRQNAQLLRRLAGEAECELRKDFACSCCRWRSAPTFHENDSSVATARGSSSACLTRLRCIVQQLRLRLELHELERNITNFQCT